jgi:CDP-glucose 4,6-dehydratase
MNCGKATKPHGRYKRLKKALLQMSSDLASKTFNFMRNKKVLITGDTGFKGSWLSMWLAKLGAEVTGFSLPAEPHQILAPINQEAKFLRHIDGDVRDSQKVNKLIGDLKPEIIFHMAAQALVRKSYSEPQLTFDTNLMGSVNVLEAVRNSDSVRSLIYITSDKCYLNKEFTRGYHENDELGGKDPYSASKACAEIAFAAYRESFFQSRQDIGIASTRAGNVIGGGDRSDDRIVPDTISSLETGDPIILRNPEATRPWQHVLDPLYGYMRLAIELTEDPIAFSGSWNFGPEDQSIRTVNDLAQALIQEWGKGQIEHQNDPMAPYESTLLHLSSEKARQRLDWSTLWDFERAAKESAKWYREILDGGDPVEISQRQIESYIFEISE